MPVHYNYINQIRTYTDQKRFATLYGENADPEITVKFEMRDVLKVHDAQT